MWTVRLWHTPPSSSSGRRHSLNGPRVNDVGGLKRCNFSRIRDFRKRKSLFIRNNHLVRERPKFIGYPGRVYRQGAATFFQRKKGGDEIFSTKKKGATSFFQRKKRGRRVFFSEKIGGDDFFLHGVKSPKLGLGAR